MSKILHNVFGSFLRNLRFILSAIIIAVIIWFAASLQIFPDVKVYIDNVAVQVVPTQLMLDENLVIETPNMAETSVQVLGKRYELGNLDGSDFNARLDLSGIKNSGTFDVDIVVEPINEDICEIISTGLKRRIVVKKIASKTFEIRVSADSVRVADGLQIDTLRLACEPSSVTITGEQDLINSITRAEVAVSYDGELLASTEIKGELALYNNKGIKVENPDISMDNTYFAVTVPIHKTKTLPLEFTIKGYPPNFDIDGLMAKMELSPSELTISSPNNSIDSLSTLNVGEMALNDLTYKVLNGYTRDTISAWLADGYRSISGNVSYSLSFTGIENYVSLPFTLTRENISISNAPIDYDVEILTNEFTVNVIGPSEHVQALSIDDISVTINLMGIEISEGAKAFKVSSCRISGTKVPSWIADTPQIDLNFKEID